MKIIFLDIDGVLNSQDWYLQRSEDPNWDPNNMTKEDYKRWEFSPTLVSNLNLIIENTGAKIVVSSTWRRGYDIKGLQELFDSVGISGEVIGKTPSIHSAQGIKNSYTIPRGCEIEYFLKENGFRRINWSKERQLEYLESSNIKNYVILDDDSDMLLNQKEHFVKTNTKEGLTLELSQKSIKILNSSLIDLYYHTDNDYYDENVFK
jgi:hypothetical protein